MKHRHLFSETSRRFFREADKANLTFTEKLHGYLYAKFPYFYIAVGTGEHFICKIFKPLGAIFTYFMGIDNERKNDKPTFADTYHGKVVTTESARKLVTLNRKIEIRDLEQVIPYPRARDIIVENPEFIVALECPCRASRKNPCLPMDVCLIIGEPFASFILEHHPNKARKITGKEAEEILEQEHARGHVHHAFFKEAMLDRFYAICNCCSCCCGAIQAMNNGTPMLASSGYVAKVDEEACVGCGLCAKVCQFNAITCEKGSIAVIDPDACMGCGACMSQCKKDALSLEKDPTKGEPLEIMKLIAEAEKAANVN